LFFATTSPTSLGFSSPEARISDQIRSGTGRECEGENEENWLNRDSPSPLLFCVISRRYHPWSMQRPTTTCRSTLKQERKRQKRKGVNSWPCWYAIP